MILLFELQNFFLTQDFQLRLLTYGIWNDWAIDSGGYAIKGKPSNIAHIATIMNSPVNEILISY